MSVPNVSVASDTSPQIGQASLPNEARSRFTRNVVANIAYTFASTLVMLWYIPFLIRYLGVAVYGVLPLANSLISYASIIADSLNVTTIRYLSIGINQKDDQSAIITFNTSLVIVSVLVCIILPIFGIITWMFPVLFRIPAEIEMQSRILFCGIALAFCMTLIASVFQVSTLILHRFDLKNLLDGIALFIRVGLVVVLFNIVTAQLWQVGLAFLCSALFALIGGWAVWRRLTPQLHVRFSAFDRQRLAEMTRLSGWTTVVRIGVLLFASTDLIVVNRFFGAEMSGRYGTLLLFVELIRVLGGTVSSVLSPAIMARYAKGDFDAMYKLAARAVKLMGLALALPIGLVCGFGQPLLGAWLGSDFRPFGLLLAVLVGHMIITLSVLPLAYVLTSYNKVRIQGLTMVTLGAINLGAAIAMAYWNGFGVIGVGLVTAIVLTTNNMLLASYSARVMNLPWNTFYPTLIGGGLHMIGVGCIGYLFTQLWYPAGWLQLGIAATIVASFYGLFAFNVSLNANERQFIIELLPTPLRISIFK